MEILFLDWETRYHLDIKVVGGDKYTRGAEGIILGYAFTKEPATHWDCLAGPIPPRVEEALRNPEVLLVAHNVPFDRGIVTHFLGIETPIERWFDTAALLRSLALPADLDTGSRVTSKSEQDAVKDKAGKALIKVFSIPRALRKTTKITYWSPQERPEEWQQFINYCVADVEAMRRLFFTLPRFNYSGQWLDSWRRDQRINDRGIPVDLVAIDAVIDAVKTEAARLNEELHALTDGAVGSAAQRDKLLAWVNERLPSAMDGMTKADVLDAQAGELPQEVEHALAIRQQTSKTSTAKFEAMCDCAVDGRIHGSLIWRGAMRTGRWAGRQPQVHNLPRGTVKDPDVIAEAFIQRMADLVYPDVMSAASACVRAMIAAPKGKKFVVSDFSNIEGRVLAWVSGEEWKLQAFREQDAGTGPDLYRVIYGSSFGIDPWQVTKAQRTVGKVEDLAFGYMGGVGAMESMAAIYRVDLDAMYEPVMQVATGEQIEKSERSLVWARAQKQFPGLSDNAIKASSIVNQLYRESHQSTVKFWGDVKEAYTQAMKGPEGKLHKAGRVMFSFKSEPMPMLLVRLPSGRRLVYQNPVLEMRTISYVDPKTNAHKTKEVETLSFWGESMIKGRRIPWTKCFTHAGKLVENLVQAIAADILDNGLGNCERAGWDVDFHVHDEIVCEMPDSPEYTAEELSRIICQAPDWANGLPLAAAGYEAYRYKKD